MDGSNKQGKNRQQMQNELMEVLRQRQDEWSRASDDNRAVARLRFLNVLRKLNSLVLYGKPLDS